jgi:hypothetical protein
MMRNSTSSTGTFVSSAIVWKARTRSSEARLKTLSIRAIRQIFCRRKGEFSCRMGYDGRGWEWSSRARPRKVLFV